MVKAKTCSCCDKTAVRKGAWTPEEDSKLTDYVTSYGHWNWRQIPKFAGLLRCGKSCRLRWKNYLMPTIRRKNYTKEEEEIIIQLHQSTRGSWTAIAARLPGRTDNDIKNHWNTVLKRRVMTHKEEPLIMLDETEKTSLKVNEVVIEQPSNYSTFMDLAALESVLDSIELWPPAIETTSADDVAVTGDGIDVSVDDYFYSSSSSSPVEGATFDDIWTYDPFWENFFDTQFDENNH